MRKTKEMVIHFGKTLNCEDVSSLTFSNSIIERVTSFKLLGVIFNNKLTWSDHVSYIISKCSKRIFCIIQLVRSGVRESDAVTVYCSIIRSVLEYACAVWHPGLTKSQSLDIERVQKRCLKIIYPKLNYNEALRLSGLDRLSCRREVIVRNLFNQIKNSNHILNNLLPKRLKSNSDILRFSYPYIIPVGKTSRYRHSFISYCLLHRY